jgi:hypothetical protein
VSVREFDVFGFFGVFDMIKYLLLITFPSDYKCISKACVSIAFMLLPAQDSNTNAMTSYSFVYVLIFRFVFLAERLDAGDCTTKNQCMDIALSLICLCHKQIRNMSPNMVFVTHGVATKDFLKTKGERMLALLTFAHFFFLFLFIFLSLSFQKVVWK